MIFRQLFDSTSGTYTYLLASRHGGEALIVDPVLEKSTPIYEYEPGTWGPDEVNRLIAPPGGWHDPVVNSPRST